MGEQGRLRRMCDVMQSLMRWKPAPEWYNPRMKGNLCPRSCWGTQKRSKAALILKYKSSGSADILSAWARPYFKSTLLHWQIEGDAHNPPLFSHFTMDAGDLCFHGNTMEPLLMNFPWGSVMTEYICLPYLQTTLLVLKSFFDISLLLGQRS